MLMAACFVLLASAPASSADVIHTYAVTLTISVDRAAHRISGEVASEAPGEFCEQSTVRVRRAMPGKDEIVARLTPYAGQWGMKSRPALRGKRVYAEVLTYELPQRPVMCLGTRSRTVTAP
jgi:hypothetical protein